MTMNTKAAFALLLIAAAASSGCLERELKPLNPCLVSGVTAQIAVTNVDKVDLLFMVDNSGSMREEQAALKDQFPKLIKTLTTGQRQIAGGGVDPNPFPPVKDLHLGVVDSDMGLVGINGIGGCDGFGDDGLLQDPTMRGCAGAVAGHRFLEYKAPSTGTPDTAQIDALSTNFGCVANLGTDGCGFEQQLESPLKALWPSVDVDVKTGKVIMPNRIKFLPDAMGNGALGHGDRENNGFLRNKVQEGLSLIAVIVVTDEEDCSSQTTKHFTPMAFLNSNDPNYNVDLNLRCFKNKANLYPVERYVNGLKALRAGNEQLVVFAAITGVPPDLVDKAAYDKAGDWTKDSVRDQFYSQILADPRMQEKEDPTKTPGNGNLTPSCVTPTSSAAPPIRIVNVAKGFGANGLVKSICTVEQFGPAMDAIIEIIAKQLGAVCLPRPLVRQADGTVGCEVVWELPPAGMAQAGTPTDCGGARGYLLPVSEGSAVTNDRDGKNCRVAQLGVNTTTHAMMASKEGQTEGWFYDDFSDDLKKSCSVATPQRVAFTPSAKPPTGVTVKLECLNETQTVADNRNDALMPDHPTIGTQCSEDAMHNAIPVDQRDAKCAVSLSDGKVDTSLMCHPTANVCVRTCSSDNDCPPAWVCDNRAETLTATKNAGHPNGSPICVNPTCGNK